MVTVEASISKNTIIKTSQTIAAVFIFLPPFFYVYDSKGSYRLSIAKYKIFGIFYKKNTDFTYKNMK